MLPSGTLAEGPPSGAKLGKDEDRYTPVFEGQPVGGISALLDAGDGEYLAMTDSGFGNRNNSAEFLLRVYRIRVDFERVGGGSGKISVEGNVQLRDPDRRISFRIAHEGANGRPLTGADFDIESLRRDPRGDLWFGDEFGPFLLHTDPDGRVLEAPIPLPGVKSPSNPNLGAGERPNLGNSGGFEGMAISEDDTILYPTLGRALEDDPERRRRFIYEFDLKGRAYTGEWWEYRTDAPDNSIGEVSALDANRFLVVECDGEQGDEARFKKIFSVDLRRTNSQGFLVKEEVVDLLSIRDPGLISEPEDKGDIGLGETFAFPFETTESVLPLDGGRLLVMNDNNYPKGAGRNPDRPDDTEAIVVRPRALVEDPAP